MEDRPVANLGADDLVLRDDGPPKPAPAIPPIPPASIPPVEARREGEGGAGAGDFAKRLTSTMDAMLEDMRFIERRREGWWDEAQRRLAGLAKYAVAMAALMLALVFLLSMVVVRWDMASLVVGLLFLLATPVVFYGSGKSLTAGVELLRRPATFKGSRRVLDLLGVMGLAGGYVVGLALMAAVMTVTVPVSGLFPGLIILAVVVGIKSLGSLLLWNAKACLGFEEMAEPSPPCAAGVLVMRAISRVMTAMMPWIALGFAALSLILLPMALLWAWRSLHEHGLLREFTDGLMVSTSRLPIYMLMIAVVLPMMMYLGSLLLDLLADVAESVMNKTAPAEGKDKEQ